MRDLFIYNSLTNKKELFVPINNDEVSIYVCGPTVYDFPHIGNCRPPVVFDLLRRVLLFIGYKVKYVSNYTDVDDKIIKKAIKEGKTEKEISTFFINEYNDILNKLNVLKASFNPRVTENMDGIISYIDNLVKTNHAYVVNSDVFFRVDSINNYGQLSNIKLDDLKSGARIEENTAKSNPFDFTLWKKTSEGITWSSPWGDGRPGWHTECCFMIHNIFNGPIDIHGGGFDLKFPHHENEIAQNEASFHYPLARYWMHNGFVNLNNEKMSKSLGNIITGRDFIDKYGGLLSRYILISTYYRSPLNINETVIENAKNEINKIQTTLNMTSKYIQLNELSFDTNEKLLIDGFVDSLCDDLNISNAMSEFFKITKELNQELRKKDIENERIVALYDSLIKMLEILGLEFVIIKLSEEDIKLLNLYNEARKNKDFETSDALRDKLLQKGIL